MCANRSAIREGPTYASGPCLARPRIRPLGRWGAWLLAPLLLLSGLARAADIGSALRSGDWNAAEAAANGAADPVAGRLVRYLRALTPGAAGISAILGVMEAERGWPQAGVLARRYADALAGERDDRVVTAACGRSVPDMVPALLRCANLVPKGEELARRAWLLGITDMAAETAFLKRWGGVVNGAMQAVRFGRLAWTESATPGGTLARQAVRLDPAMRPMAETILALKRGDAAGADLVAQLPATVQAEPIVVLELARWFRRADRDAEAARLWGERGATAEGGAPGEREAFWTERNTLARKLLRLREDELAFGVVAGQLQPGGDALFLGGWIALRRLGQPTLAAQQFRALAAGSGAAITQGRAQYWLGRSLAQAGETDASQAAFRDGARWTTTYYGQLAALAAGSDMGRLMTQIRDLHDPAWDMERALEFTGTDLAQAATLLAAWGQKGRARAFLAAMSVLQPDPVGRSIIGRFATALELPDQAVAAARAAGRDGIMLPETGWPDGVDIPPGRVERAVALGVIRQESSFDASARSPVGAMGLMQLMPATAAQISKALGGPAGELTDATANVRLGTAYLAGQIERFGALAPALAAYNAGPRRAQEWLQSIGDPASGAIDPIDWIELIPFDETRNYVQRIVENVLIYRAQKGAVLPHPVLAWAMGSGI